MLSPGRRGEARAARFLRRKGFRIVQMNYKSPSGEVDIVAMDGEVLVFVEVKTRAAGLTHGTPLEAVGPRKQARLREAAMFYLGGLREQPEVRFDVVSIIRRGWRTEIEHLTSAF